MGELLRLARPDGYELAAAAAEQVFDARPGDPPVTWRPSSREEAQVAVARLGELFQNLAGSIAAALEGARGSAETLSPDPLQGIAEVIQNADDLEAGEVRIMLREGDLLFAHNGLPVELPHVQALAVPWLTTKSEDAGANGRFGIGLMTLQALSGILDVHCTPYHVRVGDPAISWTEPFEPPTGFGGLGWTVLRVPLERDTPGIDELTMWLERWDDSSLLFCRHVRSVSLLDASGSVRRRLFLAWPDKAPLSGGLRRATARDGRTWLVYTRDAVSPVGLRRSRKATGPTTPIGIALALQVGERGQLYAGLPVAGTQLPARANAQFDPLNSRHGLAPTQWNAALVELLAEFWIEAIADLFERNAQAGWAAVPLPARNGAAVDQGPVAALEALILAHARQRLPKRLVFQVPGLGEVPLTELAAEVLGLEGILTHEEVAGLAGARASFPESARDGDGRWRRVLQDWRNAGAELLPEVDFPDAIPLLEDEGRSPRATIDLTAAAIENDQGGLLASRPCVVTEDGSHVVVPSRDSPFALVAEASPLADTLGLSLRLHAAYHDGGSASTAVRSWLKTQGAVLEAHDDLVTVRRLAGAGQAGHRMSSPLTDAQVGALREAFQAMSQDERSVLGQGVGRAILLDGYRFQAGQKIQVPVRPTSAYLPTAIDRERESFAAAAHETPGLDWIDRRYADVLRSPGGRTGLGALRFLRLLGAETAPRLRQHPAGRERFASDRRLGVPADSLGSPETRTNALRALGATYTLQDHDSPDLQAVLRDIAQDPKARRRRTRAAAVLATLGRAWDRIGDQAGVQAARDHYFWQVLDHVQAFWLWAAGSVPWLDDGKGHPRPPAGLRLRTPATMAVWGSALSGYLHRDLEAVNRRDVLAALGVVGEPSTAELVERLRELRDGDPKHARTLAAETGVVYQTLAQRLSTSSKGPGDLPPGQLRSAFEQGSGLIWTRGGWKSPGEALGGPPVFGARRSFVPQVERTERLWRTLRITEPTAADCVAVLREIGRTRRQPKTEDQSVLLDAMRLLATRVKENGVGTVARSLSTLPLWTTVGWVSARPVYAVDDPALAEALGDIVPIWQPGGELSQFRGLLEGLRVHELQADAAAVADPEAAVLNEPATALARAAIKALRDDLSRNEPATASALAVDWRALEAIEVRIHPGLALVVDGLPAGARAVDVRAKVDMGVGVLFVADRHLLTKVDGGGRAIAALLRGDRRRVAQAWRAACDRAEEGTVTESLLLADDQARQEASEINADIESRTTAFREHTAARHAEKKRRDAPEHPFRGHMPGGSAPRIDQPSPAPQRVLVDPARLELRDVHGRVVGSPPAGSTDSGTTASSRTGAGDLSKPRPGGATPREHTPPPTYSGVNREGVGLELLRRVLAGDDEWVVDLRGQAKLGADAVDGLQRFYELKVFSGPEPDRISLTPHELHRAMTTPDFFLAVVSKVEGANAKPTVRIILDPLHQLQPAEMGSIALTGVRDAHSVVYDFGPAEG